MRGFIQAIAGLLFLVAGAYILATFNSWLNAFITLIQGGIVAGIIGFGLLFLFLASLELLG